MKIKDNVSNVGLSTFVCISVNFDLILSNFTPN